MYSNDCLPDVAFWAIQALIFLTLSLAVDCEKVDGEVVTNVQPRSRTASVPLPKNNGSSLTSCPRAPAAARHVAISQNKTSRRAMRSPFKIFTDCTESTGAFRFRASLQWKSVRQPFLEKSITCLISVRIGGRNGPISATYNEAYKSASTRSRKLGPRLHPGTPPPARTARRCILAALADQWRQIMK